MKKILLCLLAVLSLVLAGCSVDIVEDSDPEVVPHDELDEGQMEQGAPNGVPNDKMDEERARPEMSDEMNQVMINSCEGLEIDSDCVIETPRGELSGKSVEKEDNLICELSRPNIN